MKNILLDSAKRSFQILCLIAVAGGFSLISGQTANKADDLQPDSTRDREIAGGETQAFQVSLDAGQFLRVLVFQKSADVSVTLFKPNNEKVFAMDLRGIGASESLSFIADIAGKYRIEVSSTDKTAKAGMYQISSVVKPNARDADKDRLAAERLLTEAADKLSGKLTKENALASLDKRRQALALWRKIGDKEWEAQTLYQIGRVYQSVWNNLSVDEGGIEFYAEPNPPFKMAVESYTQALGLSREIKNESIEANVLFWLGDLQRLAGDYQKSIEYYAQALPLYQNVGNRQREGEALLYIGVNQNKLKDVQKAIETTKQAIAVLKDANDRANQAYALRNVGVYLESTDKAKAIDYYEQSIEIYRQTGNRYGEALSLFYIADVYDKSGDNAKAIDYYNSSLAIYRELKDSANVAWRLNNLGGIYGNLKNYSKAIDFYEEASAIFRETKNRGGEASTLQNIAAINLNLGQTEKALDAYYRILRIREESFDLQNIEKVRGQIQSVHNSIDGELAVKEAVLTVSQTVARKFGIDEFNNVSEFVSPDGNEYPEGSAAHYYQFKINAGDFFQLKMNWRGGEPQIKIYEPDKNLLAAVTSSTRVKGTLSSSFAARQSGVYRVVVRTHYTGKELTSYDLTVRPPRTPTKEDNQRLLAESALRDGQNLEIKANEDSYNKEIYLAAEAKYTEAAKIFGEIGETYSQALSYELIAFLQYYRNRLNEPLKAVENFGKAKTLYEKIGEERRAAVMLSFVANVYSNPITLEAIGEDYYKKSLEYHLEALEIFRRINEPSLEASELQNIYFHYISVNEYDKAMSYLNRAVAVNQKLENAGDAGLAFLNLAVVYLKLGDPANAVNYSRKALESSVKVNNDYATAQANDTIAEAYGKLNQNKEALSYAKQNLLFYIKMDSLWDYGKTLIRLGKIHQQLGEYERARAYFDQSLEIAQNNQYLVLSPSGFLGSGIASASLGENDKAIEKINQALTAFRKFSRSEGEAESLYNLSVINRNKRDLNKALENIKEAIRIVESIRSDLKSQELRSSYFATVRDYYEFYIDLLMQLDREQPGKDFDVKAIEASERGRARSLLETLAEANADIRQGVDAKLVERERELQTQLNNKAKDQTTARGADQAKQISVEIESITTELEQIKAQIRQTSPRYAALTQPQPLSLKEIQSQVLDRDTVLLEYSLGAERSFLWLVTKDSIKTYELPRREIIETQAKQAYNLLINPKAWEAGRGGGKRDAVLAGEAASNAPRESLDVLSRMLIAPVAAELGEKRLIVVADGALQFIPFGALPISAAQNAKDEYQPLVTRHEIVSLPSASTLAVLRRETKNRPPAPKMVAVIADPVFERNDRRLRLAKQRAKTNADSREISENRELPLLLDKAARETGVREVDFGLPRLPGTRREAHEIIALVPKTASRQALDFEASRETVAGSDLSQYRFVHFATHGFLNSQNPELSGIALSMFNRHGEAQNGFFRLNEVFNLKLNADLVVLSACQTGLGKEIKGEGLVGLTRGFMYAGAPRVMVSLWSVSDDGTAELMTRVYRKMLQEKIPAAKALQLAQISMLKDQRFGSPFYWAAFTVQGEWQ